MHFYACCIEASCATKCIFHFRFATTNLAGSIMIDINTLPSPPLRTPGAPHALDGIRVVDFSHFVAGPYATVILGDLGADVIKIENAKRGDDFRHSRPPGIGDLAGPFLWTNRNKRSIALDLGVSEGREVALALIGEADVVVENFGAGVMEKFGLDYASVSKINPRLVYCSISAYGREGSFAHRRGFDPVSQAEAGIMSINGVPEGPPVVTGTPIVDIGSGMMASNAILAALVARERQGIGQQVEVVLYDLAISMLAYKAINYLISGKLPVRMGNTTNVTVPIGTFETRNGPIFICCANEQTYQKLARNVLDRSDLAEDPAWATNSARSASYPAIMQIIGDILREDDREVWLKKMHDAGVPAGAVATVAEALSSPETVERRLVSRVDHPVAGPLPNIAAPFRLGATPVADPRPAPLLHEHAEEILTQVLHYDRATQAALAACGAFGPSRMGSTPAEEPAA
jgi:crotonobetainyl-CoA:carnitine CoA-transferase CaiB-like acyl-CoA transferase